MPQYRFSDAWFVFNRLECDFVTFPSEESARDAYTKTIASINRAVGHDEHDVILGCIHERAQLLQAGEDGKDALHSLVSCKVMP